MGTPRVRSDDGFVRAYGSQSILQCGGTTSNSTPSLGLIVGNGVYRYMEDVVDQRYKKRSEEGAIFNNRLYSKRITSTVHSLGSYSWAIKATCSCSPSSTVRSGTATGTNGLAFDAVGSFTYSPSVDLDTAKILAGTNALSNVAEPEVQGQVDLVELRKTIQLLKRPIQKWDSIQKIAERRFKKAKASGKTDARNLSEFISSNWLAYRYGFIPLMLSTQGLLKALSKGVTSKRQTARGSSFVPTQTATYNATYAASTVTGGFTKYLSIVGTKVHTVRTGVLYEHTTSLRASLGMELHEIPSTAWELIPYSFVADWFANIGDYIRAVTPKAGVKILSSWTTVKTDFTYNITVTGTAVQGSSTCYTYSGAPGLEFSRKEIEVTRTPGVSVGLASKLQEIKTFSQKKDLIHLADAIALLVNGFSGKKPSSYPGGVYFED